MKRAVAALLFLVACEAQTPGTFFAFGYYWEPDPNAEYCPAYYEWIQKPATEVLTICGANKVGCRLDYTCQIVSKYSEQQAKAVQGFGQSHWDHEMMHLRKQLRHPANR